MSEVDPGIPAWMTGWLGARRASRDDPVRRHPVPYLRHSGRDAGIQYAVIVLDTPISVRWVDPGANPLPESLVAKIERATQLAVSAITCWEVAWLVRRGRLELNLSLTDWLHQVLDGFGVICLPIDRRIAVRAAELPEHHRDPADRLIIATAMERQAPLISLDGAFADYFELPGALIAE